MRERSIRSNRRHKFVDCLTSEDVNIGMWYLYLPDMMINILRTLVELRKLAWAGIPADLRPIAWQLLLVRSLFVRNESSC